MTTLDSHAFLSDCEVLTSGELSERLCGKGYTAPSARQLLRRKFGGNGIWRSQMFVLSRNERIFARSAFKGTPQFREKVLPLIGDSRPGLARLARTLQKQEVLLKTSASKLLASPSIPSNSPYPSLEKELSALEELGFLWVDGKGSVLERVVDAAIKDTAPSQAAALRANAQKMAETIVAGILVEQFRKQNLISWNGEALAEPMDGSVVFNNFVFNAAGFSFIKPALRFIRDGKPKPSPFVLDVYCRECDRDDVEGLVARINRAGQNPSARLVFLGVIAAFGFTESAWQSARANGFITINLRQHFGEAAFEALCLMERLMQSIGGDVSRLADEDLGSYAAHLEELKNDPLIKELRSGGFEVLSALVLRSGGWEGIRLNLKVVTTQGFEREVDVSAEKNGKDEVCLIECKAERAGKPLDPSYVRKFFSETVPAYIRTECKLRVPRRCGAEIWTTGSVGDDALSALHDVNVKPFVHKGLKALPQLMDMVPYTLASAKGLLRAFSLEH